MIAEASMVRMPLMLESWRAPVTVSVWYRDQIVRWSSPSTFGLVCWIMSRSSSAGWESFFFFFRFNGSLHPAKLHYCHLPGLTATSSPKSSWWIRYFWKTKRLSLHHDLTDQPHFQTCTTHFCPHHLLCLRAAGNTCSVVSMALHHLHKPVRCFSIPKDPIQKTTTCSCSLYNHLLPPTHSSVSALTVLCSLYKCLLFTSLSHAILHKDLHICISISTF